MVIIPRVSLDSYANYLFHLYSDVPEEKAMGMTRKGGFGLGKLWILHYHISS